MRTLLIAEHDNRSLNEVTRRALTAALQLGAPVDVLVAGTDCHAVTEAAAELPGIARVLWIDAPELGHGLAEPLAQAIAGMDGHDAMVAAASSAGKNLMPRLAALLDVMIVPDIVAIRAPDVFDRPIHAGSAIQTVRSRDPIRVVTIRSSSFAPAAGTGTPVPIERIEAGPLDAPSRFVSEESAASERPRLESARIVVSGGRALGSVENFTDLVTPLADALGAAVGASRAAVDSGYAPNDWQVGQTGKIVAPELYVAIGISGAIQHLAGMKDSKVIVAINKDPEAPIFQVADYGMVADLFEVLPALQKALLRPA